jgi:hypothetical protein
MSEAIYVELESVEALVAAIEKARAQGFARLGAFTPFPSDAVEHALALPRSPLPRWIFGAAALGAAGGYGLQWLLEGQLYPLNVGSRPPHFFLPFVVITFEMGVLAAGLTAFLGALLAARVFILNEPLRRVPGIESLTNDRFWLAIELSEPSDAARAEALAALLPAVRVERPELQP